MKQSKHNADSLARAARPVVEALESRTLLSASVPTGVEDAALAYDTTGKLHMAYQDALDKSLKYATRLANGRWVDGGVIDNSSANVGAMVTLALDPSGSPAAGYYDAQNGDLKYAHWTGEGWDVQAVDTRGATGLYPSLAFDAAGNPVIASYDATRDDLRLSSLYDGGWHSYTLDAEGDVGRHPSLAVDPTSGLYAVAYEATGAGELRFASATRTGKVYGTVIDPKALGGSVSLGFGAEGINAPRRVRVAYDDIASGQVRLAGAESDGWRAQVVASGTAGGAALSIDESDSAKVVYRDGAGTLALAERQGRRGAWSSVPLGAGAAGSAAAFSAAGDVAVTQPGANPASPSAPAVGERFAAAPTRTTVTNVDASTLRVDWLDHSVGESGFLVENSADGGRTWTEAAVTGRNATATNIGGLEEGKHYTFRVSAKGAALSSASTAVNASPAPAAIGIDPLDEPGWFRVNSITQDGMERVYHLRDYLTVNSTDIFYASSWATAVTQAVSGTIHVDETNADYAIIDHGAFRVGYSDQIRAQADVEEAKSELPDTHTRIVAFEDSFGAIDRDFDDKYWAADVEKFSADLDAKTVSHNAASGELSEEDEETVGAFVPVNNDDDDYSTTESDDGADYNRSDKSGLVEGEDDLLPLVLHKAVGAPGQVKLIFSKTKIRVYEKDDLGGVTEITSGTAMPLPANNDLSLLVEGIGVGDGTIRLVDAADITKELDKVKITVFGWIGALNVPQHGTYQYKAVGAGAGAKWIAPTHGSIVRGANTSDVDIKWDSGGPEGLVGKAVYQARPDYIWDIEVNVVSVKVEAPDNAFKAGTPVNGAVETKTVNGHDIDFKSIASGNGGNDPGLTSKAKVTLKGPLNGRGIKEIRVGFSQNVTLSKLKANYDGAKTHVHALQGNTVRLDGNPIGEKPYYDSTNADSIWSDASKDKNIKVLIAKDTPSALVPTLFDYRYLAANKLDSFDLQYDFNLYIIASTKDSRNKAKEVFVREAAAEGGWHWTVNQNLGNSAAGYSFNPDAASTVMPPSGWKDITDGSEQDETSDWALPSYQDLKNWLM